MQIATVQQMRELDRIAIEEEGVPSTSLMENAAHAVSDEAFRLLDRRKGIRVAILCGPGNNGGDGIAAARFLLQKGVPVRTFLVGDHDKMSPDALEMEARLESCGGRLETFNPQNPWFLHCGLFVDAIIGIGLHSQVTGPAVDAIALLGRLGNGKTIAVHIPSGIDADTGENLGNNSCRYAETVTFTLPMLGHYVGHGGQICGHLCVARIGVPDITLDQMNFQITAIDKALVRSFLPYRNPDSHKGDFGKVHIIGGSIGFSGAPMLAARGALRTGAGMVSMSVPDSIYTITAVKCDEIMPSPLPCLPDGSLADDALYPALQALAGKSACLIGPGLGCSQAAEKLLCGILDVVKFPIVLDADGLNLLSSHIDKLDARQDCPTILTPHEGEFARLGGDIPNKGRLHAALEFAQKHSCALVLKGHRSIIALPNGKAFLNTTGNSGMAKGGSGDVLAGMILALIGQGIHPVKATVAAVWLHGRAGDLAAAELGEYSMTPSDLVDKLPDALGEVTES